MTTISRSLLMIVCTVLLICAPIKSVAKQEDSDKSRPIHNTIQYDGIVSPEAIPMHVKLEEFVQNYQGELANELSRRDLAKLYKAIRKIAWLEGLRTALGPIFRQNTVCEQFKAEEDLVRIAQQIQQFDDDDLSRRQSAVEAFYTSLSTEGQDIVLEYVEMFTTPGISRSRLTNLTEIAQTDPSTISANLERTCSNFPKLRGVYVEQKTEIQESARVISGTTSPVIK